MSTLPSSSRPAALVFATGLALVAAVFLALAAPAQALLSTGDGGWLWQAPLPQGNWVEGTAWSTTSTCWVVCRGGTILRSTNAGATWEIRDSGTSWDLSAIAFGGPVRGWAVGAYGTVLRTTDGGDTWQAQDSETTYEFTGVKAIGDDRVWATTSYGKVFASTDGGTNWLQQESTVTDGLYGIEFIDASTGWMGTVGKVLKTTDGGAIWTPSDGGYAGTFMDVSYADPGSLWAVGVGGQMRLSTDSGATWAAPATAPPATGGLYTLDFVSPTHAWATGVNALLHTTDGGTSWQSQLPPLDPTEYPIFRTMAAASETHALTAANARIWSTTDGGTWVRRTGNDLLNGIGGIAAFDTVHAIAGDNAGSIVETTDGGTTWAFQRVGADTDSIYALEFSDSLRGIASGYDVALYTIDGGDTWQPATRPATGQHVRDLAYATPTHVWAVGEGGLAWESTDGGASWGSRDLGTSTALYGVAFGDATHGWAFGYNTILATIDGGANWTPQTPPTTSYFYDGTFVNAKVGWVGTGTGQVARTVNGGASWTLQSPGAGNNIENVYFLDARHGWAVSDSGTVSATPDGGRHWMVQDPGCANGLEDVAFVNARHGWVVGNGGTIMTTTTAGYGDFKRPTTRAYAASVKRGRTATLPYRVSDAKPTCGWATVTIRIKTKAGKTVKSFKSVVRPVNLRQKATFRCRLKKGTYRVVFYATDAAGWKQSKMTAGTLTVK